MKLLLDTHTFIWWRDTPENLSARAYEAISSTESDIYLSVVAVWEIQIKRAIGKIEVKGSLHDAIRAERDANGFRILSVELAHSLNIENLPPIHGDPFDRMLIAQAMVEEMTVVTVDPKFTEYGVKVLW